MRHPVHNFQPLNYLLFSFSLILRIHSAHASPSRMGILESDPAEPDSFIANTSQGDANDTSDSGDQYDLFLGLPALGLYIGVVVILCCCLGGCLLSDLARNQRGRQAQDQNPVNLALLGARPPPQRRTGDNDDAYFHPQA